MTDMFLYLFERKPSGEKSRDEQSLNGEIGRELD
jgi:hypothetical protein